MRRLMLLRHAKALPAEGYADIDRPLSAQGLAAAKAIGDFMAKKGLNPDLALVSTARRTAETWNLVATSLSMPAIRHDPLFHLASAETLFETIQGTAPERNSVLVVGHNPGMEQLARGLAGSGAADALRRLRAKFPTATLAVIDFEASNWQQIAPQSGRLAIFVTSADVMAGKQ